MQQSPHPQPNRAQTLRRQSIYLLPNLFTLAALFSGFYAIVQAMNGKFEHAALAIFAAMILDGLDGRVARMTHTQSEFGAQFDSLSDMVSFGVAPALIMYEWGLSGFGKLGWAVAFIYCAGAALRLARFNTKYDLPDIPRKTKSSFASADANNVAMIVQRLSQSDEAFCFIALHSVVPTSTDEPSLQEAMNSDYAKEWQVAIDQELAGMWEKGVFSDVPMPPDRKPVGTKYVLKIKRNADGTIERFKARLVAQGFSQQQGVDYGQTFSPVVATDVLRTVLALAAANSWDVQALDFTQAYLNADIDADLWVSLPDNKIVKVEKALYGFKQSALQWYDELRNTIIAVEKWQPSKYDDCLYYKVSDDGEIAILVTYVDDLIFTGNYSAEIQRMKQSLLQTYEGRDIGTPEQLFGVHVTANSNVGITLDQIKICSRHCDRHTGQHRGTQNLNTN